MPKTVVMMQDDSTPGQVFLYLGTKQATGTEVQKAGLVGGALYGIAATGIGNSADGNSENLLTPGTTPTSGSFALKEIPGAAGMTGAQIEAAADAAGVSEWWRPEDGAWDTLNPNRYYFATTAGTTSPSRLWALDFKDINDPAAGGSFHMLLEGTEGQVMFDNLTVDARGHVILSEDPGNFPAAAKVWDYDPEIDTLNAIAKHDPARFGDTLPGGGTIAATAPFTTDEESSGVLDVTGLLGDADTMAYLIDTQAHYAFPGPLGAEVVEGGQLQVIFVDAVADGTRGDDTLRGSTAAEEINGRGGNDLILGGSGDDTLKGGVGNDVLVGGKGADLLIGGAGQDVFRYASAAEGGDIIRGFSVAEDGLEVSAAGFGGGLALGALAAARFVAGKAPEATQAFGQFLYDTKAGELWWDADGTGAGTAVLIADFAGHPKLTAADIAVIA